MKKKPKKKAAQVKYEMSPLLFITESEKSHVESIHDDIQANLRQLHEGVQACPADSEKCVAALLDAAVSATAKLEAIYGSSCEVQRDLIRRVALRSEKFVGIYEFRLPTSLRDLPRSAETRGDRMRRELTKEWQASAPLYAAGGTEYDWLRLSMEGFVRAVNNPARARPVDNPAKTWLLLDWYLEISGGVSVPENVRTELLSPDAQKDGAKWARAYVDWYDSLHPLVFKDAKGNWIIPSSIPDILDPIHRIAYEKLATLQSSNPDEKSPLNALRAKVRERFSAAFQR